MPNRIIKESICYSNDLDKLTSFAETVFYRLLVRVDDYGRIDARPNFLKSMLFVTKNVVSEKNVSEAVAQMASLGLVRLYEVDEKPFLCLPKWHLHQRIRDSRAKYPEPPQETDFFESSPQSAATCGESPPESNPNPNPKENTSYSLSTVPFDEIISAWNSLNLSQIIVIQGKRRESLNARIKEYGIDKIYQAIENVKKSAFLRGQNKNNWTITIDWFIKPNNFPKVLEGNYADDKGNIVNTQIFEEGDIKQWQL